MKSQTVLWRGRAKQQHIVLIWKCNNLHKPKTTSTRSDQNALYMCLAAAVSH